MPLVKPALVSVSPGQPVTAQAWNAILVALGALFDAMLALGNESLDVEVRFNGAAVPGATVTALPASGAARGAVPPRAGGTAYTLTGLTAGSWTVHVSAPGFAPAQLAVTIPAAAPVTLNLTETSKPMPDLLGDLANSALSQLTAAGIQLQAIYDVTGDEVAKNPLPAKRQTSRVLFQYPLPGERVAAASAAVRLVLSAEPEVAESSIVPPLVGLSYAELVKVLNEAGLTLGNVRYIAK
jgi:Carboxypeptidase regulatory-like domain